MSRFARLFHIGRGLKFLNTKSLPQRVSDPKECSTISKYLYPAFPTIPWTLKTTGGARGKQSTSGCRSTRAHVSSPRSVRIQTKNTVFCSAELLMRTVQPQIHGNIRISMDATPSMFAISKRTTWIQFTFSPYFWIHSHCLVQHHPLWMASVAGHQN